MRVIIRKNKAPPIEVFEFLYYTLNSG